MPSVLLTKIFPPITLHKFFAVFNPIPILSVRFPFPFFFYLPNKSCILSFLIPLPVSVMLVIKYPILVFYPFFFQLPELFKISIFFSGRSETSELSRDYLFYLRPTLAVLLRISNIFSAEAELGYDGDSSRTKSSGNSSSW